MPTEYMARHRQGMKVENLTSIKFEINLNST